MRAALTGYCLGIYLLSWAPSLHGSVALLLFSVWSCVLLAAAWFRNVAIFLCICGMGVGLLWHWHWGVGQLRQALPAQLEGEDLLLKGTVTGIPQHSDFGQRFDFLVFSAKAGGAEQDSRQSSANLTRVAAENRDSPQAFLAGSKLQLSFFGDTLVSAGESWQLELRLKQLHGFANPGSYNREAYLFRQDYVATGYVRKSEQNIRLGASPPSVALLVTSLRHGLLSRLQPLLEQARHKNLILALILGERSQLDQQQWDLFTATGTNHLFVISGLHIGLVALLCFRGTAGLLRFVAATLLPWPAQRTAALLAMSATLAYSVIAGWGLPAQRASTMVLLFLCTYLISRKLSLSLRFTMALAFVLSLDPLASTSMGFWLSFTAVGALLFFALPIPEQEPAGHKPCSGYPAWARYLRPQWIVFAALFLPLTLLLGQVSLIAPLANIVTIPLVGLLLVPLLLVASLVSFAHPNLAQTLFAAGDFLLDLIIQLLNILVSLFGLLSSISLIKPEPWQILFLVPGVFLFLLPKGIPFRSLAVPLLLPAWFVPGSAPNAQLRLDTVDVGQGLAVLVRTRQHALLYDTGPGTADGWDAGQAIVLPVLAELGVRELDRIIVSHSDSDHAGGLGSVLSSYPGSELLLGSPADLQQGREPIACVEGDSWQWDEVEFSVLHPGRQWGDDEFPKQSNNQSCVLRIQSDSFSVLLPGDITAEIEKQLVLKFRETLRSTVLFAPHHGSNTSSSYAFLKQVAAEHVIVSSGYGNGFNHPAAKVVAKHSQMGSRIHNTATSGMISISSSLDGGPLHIAHYRSENRRYWAWSGNRAVCRYC